MAFTWMRRAGLLAACASALLLAACGGGTVASQLSPSRVIVFGDGMADVGQAGAHYTVNDGSVNNWAQYVANAYNFTLTPSSQGGLDYAWGNARVTATPDAAGNGSTPTVKAQIDQFLANNTIGDKDLVIVSAGTSDVIVQAQAALTGAQGSDQMIANVQQAGSDLADQVKRLVAAGGKHVVIAGPYNLGRSPWANETGAGALLQSASSEFNNKLLVSLVNYGATVLYIDAALYFNQQTSSTSNTSNYTTAACTSVDSGPGIGTGSGQVNSFLCTPSTILAGQDYTTFLWADRVYPTPRGHQLFGDYARGQIHNRW
ncbi:MAG: SGNH/GDSL hydrolase family protein [Burkholderiales bacterium]|nr:SGNH/GDSL hydrolase family protein [Burkholderiales bacterium]